MYAPPRCSCVDSWVRLGHSSTTGRDANDRASQVTIDSSRGGGGGGRKERERPLGARLGEQIPNEFLCSAEETSCDLSSLHTLQCCERPLDPSQELKGNAKVAKFVYSSLKEPRPCLHVHLGA